MEIPTVNTPCILWQGWIAKNGYGYKYNKELKKWKLAHRVLYEQLKGKISKNHHIDHLCRNPACVNIEHLEAVTPRTNYLRGVSPAALNARKTHCKRGHILKTENLRKCDLPRRICRICFNLNRNIWRRKLKLKGFI